MAEEKRRKRGEKVGIENLTDEEKQRGRRLSESFMENLKKENGLLNPLLKRVKGDSTLCLEIRENYISIYYRGGSLLKITESKSNTYVAGFDENYCEGNVPIMPKNLKVESDVKAWIIAFPLLKQAMDFWFNKKRQKAEREFQQVILRENNGSRVGNSTDYFIIDIEYEYHNHKHKRALFDLVAIEWESEKGARKLPKGYKPKLCFMEVKYGDKSLTGSASMLKHIEDFRKYLQLDPGLELIREEMLTILRQKRELGLIPALEHNKNVIKEFSDETDFIFLLVNHDPASGRLRGILNDIQRISNGEDFGFEIKFCASNFMGYGLYKENVYLLNDFMERFKKQISCKL